MSENTTITPDPLNTETVSPDPLSTETVSPETVSYESDRALDLRRPKGSRQLTDNLARGLVWVAAIIAIVPLVWILTTVISRGAPMLFSAEPDFTKICAVAEDATEAGFMDVKRLPAGDCDAGIGEAKWHWLSGGEYPAVNDFVLYRPVSPVTVDPNAVPNIRINGQLPESPGHSIATPDSDDSGTVRQLSGIWWTDDQRSTDMLKPNGGALHAIIGTLMLGLITSVIAVPLGVLGSIYLVEYARGKKFAKVVSFMVDILTGVPSIVAALFIYSLLITMLGFGRSTLASSLALVILMLPTVLRSTEEMLKLVPDSLREASYALGVTKWKTILNVVIPTSRKGILTGIVLGVARVMGETAPLIILLNYGPRLSLDPTSQNMGSLPTMIMTASEVAESYPGAERGWGAALTLILIVMGLNLAAKFAGSTKKSR